MRDAAGCGSIKAGFALRLENEPAEDHSLQKKISLAVSAVNADRKGYF